MMEDTNYHQYCDSSHRPEDPVSESDRNPSVVRSQYSRNSTVVQRVRSGDHGHTDQNGTLERSRDPKQIHEKLDEDDDDASSVDENYDVLSLASSIEEQLTWRGRMQVVLHSDRFHIFIIALIILDVLIVLFELFLDLGAFGNIICPFGSHMEQKEFCHFHRNTRGTCIAPARLILKNQTVCGLDPQFDCLCGFRKGQRICLTTDAIETEGRGIDPSLILHASSLFILSVFMLETLSKMLAFRLKYFVHKSHVFDGTIIIISWIIDLSSLIREEAFQGASLIILLRLWRVVRIIAGSVLSSEANSNAALHRTKLETKKAIHALHKAQQKMDQLEKSNADLKRLLKKVRLEREAELAGRNRAQKTEQRPKKVSTV